MSLRVFAPSGSSPRPGQALTLDGDESRYLRKVRRARDGAAIELLDGCGGLWSATVTTGDGRSSTVEVGAPVTTFEPRRELTLLLGLPDTPATIQALTHATELGAETIALVRCARSQGRPPSQDRIERVLRASLRQCGRPSPPRILGPLSFAEALELKGEEAGYVCYTALRAQDDDERPAKATSAASLLVGPEGGLTPEEVEAALRRGFSPLALGPWVLRTETAALVGLSRLLFDGLRP